MGARDRKGKIIITAEFSVFCTYTPKRAVTNFHKTPVRYDIERRMCRGVFLFRAARVSRAENVECISICEFILCTVYVPGYNGELCGARELFKRARLPGQNSFWLTNGNPIVQP